MLIYEMWTPMWRAHKPQTEPQPPFGQLSDQAKTPIRGL